MMLIGFGQFTGFKDIGLIHGLKQDRFVKKCTTTYYICFISNAAIAKPVCIFPTSDSRYFWLLIFGKIYVVKFI